MRKTIVLRELTVAERQTLEQLAHSRTGEARLVQRAQLLLALADGHSPSDIADEFHVTRAMIYDWMHRFNEEGLQGLQDRRRSGRPPTYTAEEVAEVIATALTNPKVLQLEFGGWTLDRLQAYLNEHKGIAIKRSRIDEILRNEGLRWRKQETWFGERVDPDFAEKRGSSRNSTRHRPQAVL